MENQKFEILKENEEWTIWNDWLRECTSKDIPLIRIYKKTKYSIVDYDYISFSKNNEEILRINCDLIENFFNWLWKKYLLVFSFSCLTCTFSKVPNDIAEYIAIEIYDFLNNLIIENNNLKE